jgi:ABC-type Mn2+/Zn2+ transport system ATPase subunit/ABC-type Zn uptake system ZnuABC Zn-binding protein ZnuA
MTKSILATVRFRIVSFLFLITLSVSASSPKVVATTTIIADIAQNIAGDKLKIICLMPVGGDPHIYEPNPGDTKKVAEADLILKNGLHLEGWLNKLIDNAGGERIIVEVAKNVKAIQNESLHSSPDPHAWMTPLNGVLYARAITEAFCQLDAKNATYYTTRLEVYEERLRKLDNYIRTKIETIPVEKRVLVTSHDAFRYYGRDYNVKVESAMGTSTDAEVQVADMNNLIKVIKERKINAIFVESTINPKLLQQIARDNGIVIGGSLFSDSLGDKDSGASTYIEMLTYNTDILVKALTSSSPGSTEEKSSTLLFVVIGVLFFGGFLILFFRIHPNHLTNVIWNTYKIEVNELSTSYDRKTVLSNINMVLESGKLYGLLGPNGAGKSTLFKSILGLVKYDSGEILINGKRVEEIRNKIAYIPQKEEIDWSFPATVIDIVLTGRLSMKKPLDRFSSDDARLALEALQKVGMSEFTNRQISDLSGGQQQRVFIARALCQEAEILMFDEPFVGVDITTEEKIMQIIKGLVNANKTVIMIHHDLSKVKEYFDAVIMINQRLIACGSTERVFNNENIAATYGGRLTILQETDGF